MFSRRQLLLSSVCGAGYVGLRTLATGLPMALLLDPRRALADMTKSACAVGQSQFVIFSTSGAGDPLNTSVPGTYEDPNIVHSPDPMLAPQPIMLGGKSFTAAAAWGSLPQSVLDRTCFFHLMTNTPVHPKEPNVLKLMDTTTADEMLPSILAKRLAPCLGTVQAQPISLGANSPSEGLTYGGHALPRIPPLALKATLTSPAGPLTDLQSLRDQTLNQLYDVYRNDATKAQRDYIDALVTSQTQLRSIRQDLLDRLASIADNGADAQILAAVTLIEMKVAPVITIHIPFGGDNHRDIALATESAETLSGIATIAALMSQLQAAGLEDQVMFMSLNVFGRTLAKGNEDGRQHNKDHQVSLAIGKSIQSGVIGGVAPNAKDYGALPIDSKSGAGTPSGDIAALDTLPSFGRTMLAAAGVAADAIDAEIKQGATVTAALA
jgi:hypothetical protein